MLVVIPHHIRQLGGLLQLSSQSGVLMLEPFQDLTIWRLDQGRREVHTKLREVAGDNFEDAV